MKSVVEFVVLSVIIAGLLLAPFIFVTYGYAIVAGYAIVGGLWATIGAALENRQDACGARRR